MAGTHRGPRLRQFSPLGFELGFNARRIAGSALRSLLSLALVAALSPHATSADQAAGKAAALGPPRQPSAPGAAVYLISPRDGEVTGQTFTAVFGLRGMGVAPAGTTLPNTGHHHLLIDYPGTPALGRTLPASAQLRHFGGGQTQAVLNLPPGQHRLRLLFADGLHVPHNPPLLSEPVVITVR